jgi:hypothetical protein
MAMVEIRAAGLSSDQKQRIGDRVIDALHREGISPSAIVVLFKRETSDMYLDGGLLVEASIAAPEVVFQPHVTREPVVTTHIEAPSRIRHKKEELEDLKSRLASHLQANGALSSFQAQEMMGLKDSAWAASTLRRLFSELEASGQITKQGQKRGTRYVWLGITNQPQTSAPILVKKSPQE